MNGFLSRLAAKELGTAPALTPRVPSRFEAEAPRSATELSAPSASEEEGTALPVPVRAEHDDDAARSRTEHDSIAARAEPFAAPKKDIARQEAPATGSPESRHHDVQPPAARTIARETLVERVHLSTNAAQRTAVPEAPSPFRIAPDRIRIAQATPMADAADRAESDPQPVNAPKVNAIVPAPSPGRAMPPTKRAHRNDAGPARATETVVNVSIGRIEVRASPSARTPPARRDDIAQPMRLEEYLRGRGGRSAS